MTLFAEQDKFTHDVAKLLAQAWELGFTVTFGEVQRPIEMQKLYVQSGRSKTMDSQHIKRLAIDLNLFKENRVCTRADILPLGLWWEQLDPVNRWGGSWRGLVDTGKSSFVDAPHFERQG